MKPTFPSRGAGGFSLIEMIGVLAVLAVLAAVLAPPMVRRIAEANGTREERNVEQLGQGLLEYTRVFQAVPGADGWVSNIATMTGMNEGEVRYVNPADTNSWRVYLVHPGFVPYTGLDPVLTNRSSGFSAPTNARVMILSSSKSSLRLPVSSGKASDTADNREDFENIWNWNYSFSTKAPPSGWPGEWAGGGEYLHVHRVNLASDFKHVTVSNTKYPTSIPFARFNGLPTVAFNVTNAVDAYYPLGTVIRVYKHDTPYVGPPASPDELDLTHTVEKDVNFIYTGSPSQWRIP